MLLLFYLFYASDEVIIILLIYAADEVSIS